MEKKLTVERILELDENYSELKEVKLSNGDYLIIRPYLSKDDVNNIIEKYGSFLLDKDVKNNIKNNDLFIYLQCFVIMNNSDIIENSNIKTNSDKLKFCKLLSNNIVLFDEIMHSFDVSSLDLIITKFTEIMNVAKQMEALNKNKNKKKNAISKK